VSSTIHCRLARCCGSTGSPRTGKSRFELVESSADEKRAQLINPNQHTIPTAHTKPTHGFTLLEVLIALAVVSIALAALVSAIGTQTRITERLRAKAFAQIVAGNVYNELRLAERWPEVGERDGRSTMAQQRFTWRMAIKTTELPDMRRVEISVLRDADTSTNSAAADPLISTSAFIINR
jgi:general secretion pathway protein I